MDRTQWCDPTLEQWEWQFAGACRRADPNLFFHPEGERGFARRRRAEAAKRFCAGCSVLEVCRERSLETREPFGVWGGLSEDERHALLTPRPRQLVTAGE
jgi:WhiB family redox-sensing transcriptional regulator